MSCAARWAITGTGAARRPRRRAGSRPST
jgi:hypothetical protein